MIVMIMIIIIFRLLTSVEGVRGHESAGGAMVEEELIEAQRRSLHKEHLTISLKDYDIFPEMIFANSLWSIQTRSSSWATNYLHKVPSEPRL